MTVMKAADPRKGVTQFAFWVDNAPAPVMLGADPGPERLWSLSKPVAALAAIEATGAKGPTAALLTAITDALTKSDNCAQRLVVVELQTLKGGIAGAQAAFAGVLGMAGVKLPPAVAQTSDISGDPTCRSYLSKNHADVKNPFGEALLFGTTEWKASDAILFAHALAMGTFGKAGETVLGLMRLAKDRPAEGTPTDYTSPLDEPPSGGTFPLGWAPAYKGGWGGHNLSPPNFRASQIVVLAVGTHRLALYASYGPAVQPPSDDPGLTHAAQVLQALFTAVQKTILGLGWQVPAKP